MSGKAKKTVEDCPLPYNVVAAIMREFRNEFSTDPRYRVARKLRALGLDEHALLRFKRTGIGCQVPEDEIIGVQNALRNLELGCAPQERKYPHP